MAYNGAVLARARERLAERREQNAGLQQQRLNRVYALFPRVAEIDEELRRQMAALASLTFSRDPGAGARIDSIEPLLLQSGVLLPALGQTLPRPGQHSSVICHDTGYNGAEMCDCLRREYKAELTRELSGLLKDGGESFDGFRLDYYSTAPDAVTGVSPREVMSLTYDYCREYAKKFSRSSPSLIFRGGPGLGKTFLSACIAREVSARGFSVAYESAPAALGEFETQRFSRDPEEAGAAAAKVREYLNCDLMILDDLGTEMTTSFTVSALYQLVNTRLTESRQTIISTNLDDGEILRRYGGQVASRLSGEFELLSFAGSDIRRLRKEQSL